MKKSIESILAKGKWTGAEIGKLLIENYINDIIQHGNGNQDYEPLFSQADFEKMVSSLETDRQRYAYLAYLQIYRFMIDGFNKSQSYIQQFCNGYYRYMHTIQRSQEEEENIKKLLQLPLVLSPTDYNRLYATAGQFSRQIRENGYNIIYNTLKEAVESIYSPGKLPQSIRDAMLATEEETASREGAIAFFKERLAEPIFILPDGTKSNTVSPAEWNLLYLQATAKTRGIDPSKDQHELLAEVGEANAQRQLKAVEALYKGLPWLISSYKLTNAERESLEKLLTLDEEEQERILEAFVEVGSVPAYLERESHADSLKTLKKVLGFESVTREIGKEYPPGSPTKFDILCDALGYYFNSIIWTDEAEEPEIDAIRQTIAGEGINGAVKLYGETAPASLAKSFSLEETEENRAKLKQFIEDYPMLYNAVIAFIDSKLPGFASLSEEWLIADIFTVGTLADAGIDQYIEMATPGNEEIAEALEQEENAERETSQALYRYKRARYNGIAVIQNTKQDSYTEPDLLKLWQEDIEDEGTQEEIKALKEKLIDASLSYLLSYNKFLEILNREYGIDISIVKADTEYLGKLAERLNGVLYILYGDLEGTDEDKRAKRALFKRAFEPISLEANQPTEEAIAEVEADIERLGTTKEAYKAMENMEHFIVPLLKSTPAFNRYTLNTLYK